MTDGEPWEAQRRSMMQRLRDLQARVGADVELASERRERQRGEVLDAGERSEDEENSFNRDALRARHAEEMLALLAALQRIEQGSYGRCVECQDDIDAARLQACPESARCLACERRYEARARLGPVRGR